MPLPFLICIFPLSYAFSVSFLPNLQELDFNLNSLNFTYTHWVFSVSALFEFHALRYILYASSSQIYLLSSEFSPKFRTPVEQLPTLLRCLMSNIGLSNLHCLTPFFLLLLFFLHYQLLSPSCLLLPINVFLPITGKSVTILTQAKNLRAALDLFISYIQSISSTSPIQYMFKPSVPVHCQDLI